ncbi:MAG: DUF4434 domain-containing protein [Phycisphaerales bacterium]
MLKQGVQAACVIAAASMASPAAAKPSGGAIDDKPLVTGTFIQLNETSASAGGDWWRRQVEAMHEVGMDTVVIQYVGYGERYFYPTDIEGVKANPDDSLEHILAAADDTGIRVFMGLQLSDKFWGGAFDHDANLKRNRSTLDELHTRYGKHHSLVGWYIPEEISDHTARNPEFAESLLDYIGSITKLARESTGLSVMISPYFGQQPDARAYADWWDKTALPRINIDILAMQDGVGTHRTTIEEARPVYEALAPVLKKHEVTFWANNECFDQLHGWPVDEQDWAAGPVGFKKFLAQVRSTYPLVEKSITFEFTTYMDLTKPGPSSDLYEAYRAYFAEISGRETSGQTVQPLGSVIKTTFKGANRVANARQE